MTVLSFEKSSYILKKELLKIQSKRTEKVRFVSVSDSKLLFLFLYLSAYEVWGSPEMLNKEKTKRAKARQNEYEGIYKHYWFFLNNFFRI